MSLLFATMPTTPYNTSHPTLLNCGILDACWRTSTLGLLSEAMRVQSLVSPSEFSTRDRPYAAPLDCTSCLSPSDGSTSVQERLDIAQT